MGRVTTVWDAEVTAIAEGPRRERRKNLPVLTDSRAAIVSIITAGRSGKVRTGELKEVLAGWNERAKNTRT